MKRSSQNNGAPELLIFSRLATAHLPIRAEADLDTGIRNPDTSIVDVRVMGYPFPPDSLKIRGRQIKIFDRILPLQ